MSSDRLCRAVHSSTSCAGKFSWGQMTSDRDVLASHPVFVNMVSEAVLIPCCLLILCIIFRTSKFQIWKRLTKSWPNNLGKNPPKLSLLGREVIYTDFMGLNQIQILLIRLLHFRKQIYLVISLV